MESANVPGSGLLVHCLLDEAAARTPDAHAVRDEAGCWSYRELVRQSHAAAAWVQSKGVGRGDRVVVQLPTDRELVALFFGVSRVGAVFVPLNPAMKEFHRGPVVANAEPRLVVTAEDADSLRRDLAVLRERAATADPVEVDPDDIAVLIYTSGSTAAPKGVICPHAQVVFAARAIQQVLGYRPDDVVFCRFPMSWDYGLYKVLLSCLGGSEIVLAGGESDLVLLKRMREVGATVVPIVPSLATMIATLAARDGAPDRSNRVRMFTNTGAALSQSTIDRLRRAFPGARVVRQFGQTECKRIAIMPPEQDQERSASVGRPLPGTTVLILDPDGRALPVGEVGEIVVAGPHVMPGYWRAPEISARTFRPHPDTGELRLHTGDYGRLDQDGYLYFNGRRDDMFKRKGIRMSTLEIEAAALDIPGVRAAGAIAPTAENDLSLVVEADLSPHVVLRELAKRLEPAKVPAVCRVVDRLPLTTHGKNATADLVELLEHGLDRSEHPGPSASEAAAAPDYAGLVECFGTPLYVYDLDRVEDARRSLFDALPTGVEVFYALKANPHPELARALRTGPGPACRAEISSTGELDAAIEAGFAPGDCLYTGPGKTGTELDLAIDRGVRLFSVESPTDAQHVGEAARKRDVVADCLLRINDTAPGASSGIRMMGRASQFGIDSETLPALMPQLIAIEGVRIVGAHFFSMSNAKDEANLLDEFEHAVALAARLQHELALPLEFLDIGGGFSSPYAVPGERAGYDTLRTGLERILDRFLPQWRAGQPRLAVESGRYLVGGSGRLLSGVTNIKESRGQRFVILDAGINAIGGLSGLGRLMPMAVELDDTPDASGSPDRQLVSLVGPLCTPGDKLGAAVRVPAVDVGDVITIPNVGAYGVTASLLGFLGRPAPTEVVLRNGEVVSVSRIECRRGYQPSPTARPLPPRAEGVVRT